VDTRPTQVYEVKHARGAISIPAFALAARPLPRSTKVVVYDGGAGATDAETAARTLQSKGHPQFWILEGGLTAWEAQSLPIVVQPGEAKGPLVEPIGALELLRLIDAGERLIVLDLRSEDLYKQSRVPGAVSAPDDGRIERAVSGGAPADLIVLYDDGSGDAREKAETLRRRGFRAVKYLHGGMLAWRDKSLRVER
jgi:rhodanese-related sulfurtransferase